jgi:biotin transport system substrate-specific component
MSISRTLSGLGNREIVTNKTLCRGIGVMSFLILTTFGAFLKIPLPFTPVPITLQTFFVLLSGAVIGKRLGSLSQASYLLLGSAGLPLFADPRGLGGPTGGYLIGFLLASWVVGWLVSFPKGKNIFWIIFVMLSGSVLIYSLGCLQLALITQCGLKKALLLGILPFIPGDFLKLLGAAFVYKRFGKRFQKIFMI